MKAALMASMLLFWMAESVHANFMLTCEIFDRSSTQTPQFVRDYLDESKGLFVRMCSGGAQPIFGGASDLVHDGDICRYVVHQLRLSRTNPSRLEREEARPQTYMSVTKSTCPSPGAIDYTATNDVPQDVFERLFQVWHDAISSSESFDRTLSGVADAAVLRRLRNMILQGRSNLLAVTMVTMDRDLGVWKSYRLNVEDPDHSDRFYAVTVSSQAGIYGISNVRASIY
jgi:hypothetical protein